MLKTQFSKTFYLCNSFLFITTSFTANSLPKRLASFPEEKFNASIAKTETLLNNPEIKLNSKGMLFVKKYIKNSNACLVNVKKRSAIPFTIIDSVFRRYGLPVELKYLAVIESELKPSALSHVGARGPWQLMPATAHVLGLKVTRQSDERTNYYKSSTAAAKYLRDLYAQFNDWLLVLAAYNGGPRPVYSAIQKSGSKNFWVLQNYLPAESREHVKKFIATHYYFEGRGSETTLTRAENAKFKKMVNEFVKSRNVPEMAKNKQLMPVLSYATTLKQWTINDDMRQLVGFTAGEMIVHLHKNPNIPIPAESSEQKFKRLMAESAESLKKSRRMI